MAPFSVFFFLTFPVDDMAAAASRDSAASALSAAFFLDSLLTHFLI